MPHLSALGPRVAAVLAALMVAAAASPAAADQPHDIQAGETLTEIAGRYGVSIDALVGRNGIIDPNLIYAGERIIVPGPESAMRPATNGTYRIRAGDTLWGIAFQRGTTVESIVAANPAIVDPNRVFADQEIAVPGEAGPATGGPSSDGTSSSSAPAGDIAGLLAQHAASYGLDPTLAQAIAWQESGWNQSMVSSSGAMGVMQIMPATAEWLASDVVGAPLDVAGSASDNIVAGVAYLRYLMDRSDTEEHALAAYYQGPGSIQRYGILPDTERYVVNVFAIRGFIAQNGVPPR